MNLTDEELRRCWAALCYDPSDEDWVLIHKISDYFKQKDIQEGATSPDLPSDAAGQGSP